MSSSLDTSRSPASGGKQSKPVGAQGSGERAILPPLRVTNRETAVSLDRFESSPDSQSVVYQLFAGLLGQHHAGTCYLHHTRPHIADRAFERTNRGSLSLQGVGKDCDMHIPNLRHPNMRMHYFTAFLTIRPYMIGQASDMRSNLHEPPVRPPQRQSGQLHTERTDKSADSTR